MYYRLKTYFKTIKNKREIEKHCFLLVNMFMLKFSILSFDHFVRLRNFEIIFARQVNKRILLLYIFFLIGYG